MKKLSDKKNSPPKTENHAARHDFWLFCINMGIFFHMTSNAPISGLLSNGYMVDVQMYFGWAIYYPFGWAFPKSQTYCEKCIIFEMKTFFLYKMLELPQGFCVFMWTYDSLISEIQIYQRFSQNFFPFFIIAKYLFFSHFLPFYEKLTF